MLTTKAGPPSMETERYTLHLAQIPSSALNVISKQEFDFSYIISSSTSFDFIYRSSISFDFRTEVEVSFDCNRGFSFSRFKFKCYLFQPSISSFSCSVFLSISQCRSNSNIQELVWISHEIERFHLIAIESFIALRNRSC